MIIINTNELFNKYETEKVANCFMDLLGSGVEFQGKQLFEMNADLFYIDDSDILLDQLEYSKYLYLDHVEWERSEQLINKTAKRYGINTDDLK